MACPASPSTSPGAPARSLNRGLVRQGCGALLARRINPVNGRARENAVKEETVSLEKVAYHMEDSPHLLYEI